MPPLTENQVRQIIRGELQALLASDRYIFHKLLQFLDGRNIQFGLTTGSKIGTAAAQKIAFHGVTPVIQASPIAAPTSPGGLYSQVEAQSMETAVNAIRT